MSFMPVKPERRPLQTKPISSRVRALEAVIAASLDALANANRRPAQEALLFVGNWNDALPRLLIQDPVLEPVDKIVWAVIKTCADPRRGTAFPSYLTIARLANIRAEGTVARALAILRATRWLTLCGRARDARGQFRGSVYALHDEPLPLVDTLHLDQTYLRFAYQAAEHRHARVAVVATGVVRSLELDSVEGGNLEAVPDPLVARVQAQHLIASRTEMLNATTRSAALIPGPASVGTARCFSIRAEVLPEPSADGGAPVPVHHLQHLQAARSEPGVQIFEPLSQLQILQSVKPQILSPQNLKSASCSSIDNNQTTTTTATAETPPSNFEGAKFEGGLNAPPADASAPTDTSTDPVIALGKLRWPNWLSPNHRRLAALELRGAPPTLRQSVLDLLDQRHRDGITAVADPLRSPVQYLRSLCQRALSGTIVLPSAPAVGVPDSADRTAPAHARLDDINRQLRIAQSDSRHWQRLSELTRIEDQKTRMLALADAAHAEAQRLHAAIDEMQKHTAASPHISAKK